jgi:hypothetical protein
MLPIWRPPSAFRVGRLLGGQRTTPPPRFVASVQCAILRRSCTAGGATGGCPAFSNSFPRYLPCCEYSHHPSFHNGRRYAHTAVWRYGACRVVRRGAPRPRAGDADATLSVTGHGTNFHHRHNSTGPDSCCSPLFIQSSANATRIITDPASRQDVLDVHGGSGQARVTSSRSFWGVWRSRWRSTSFSHRRRRGRCHPTLGLLRDTPSDGPNPFSRVTTWGSRASHGSLDGRFRMARARSFPDAPEPPS